MAKIFNKFNLLVSKVASKDKIRPLLTGVLFKDNETIACDGISLVKITTPKHNADDFPTIQDKKPITIENEFVVSADKLATSEKNGMPIINETFAVVSNEAEKIQIATTDLETSNIKEIKKIQGDYPKTDDIFNQLVESDYQYVYIDASKLEILMQVCKKFTEKNIVHKIKIGVHKTDNYKPLSIKTTGGDEQELTGLLMPMKKSDTDNF